jgi:hypothetical protein
MMRHVRVKIGTLLAATLLTLCVGLQVLEATGRWDRTLQDTGDEAVIVTVVLCIGAALVVARVARYCVSLSAIRSWVVLIRDAAARWFVPRRIDPTLDTSPPVGLRI